MNPRLDKDITQTEDGFSFLLLKDNEEIDDSSYYIIRAVPEGYTYLDSGTHLQIYTKSRTDIILGKVHNTIGPTNFRRTNQDFYFLYGKLFKTKEEWFEALSPEDKREYLWKMA